MRFLFLKYSFLLGLTLSSFCYAEEVVVDLKDPVYCEGVLKTVKGGVLKTGCLRIQAQKICYHSDSCEGAEISRVIAEGDLMVLNKAELFVGSKLEYDFTTNTGVIYEGRLVSDPWFVGGKTIIFHSDGSFNIENGYLTTCEEENCDFFLYASKICVRPNKYAQLKDIRFYFFKIPFLWIPQYRANLDSLDDIPLRFSVAAGGYRGTRFTAKYKLFSVNDWVGFARMDFTLARGPGGGIEIDHCPKHDNRAIFTRSYMARDHSYDDPKNRLRYRFQGLYDEVFCRENVTAHVAYDILSDSEMAADYSYKEFDLPTGRRTDLFVTKKSRNWISEVSARVKVNNFQTVNQQLPTLEGSYRPFTIGSTGIISDNRFRTEYLDFSFASGTPSVTDFRSTRIEINPMLYRPFHQGPVTITPEAGFIGVFYGNNPKGNSVGQAIGTFGIDADAHFYKYYGAQKHIVEPYIQYQLLTSPTTPFKDQFIFDIDDGFAKLNLMRFGIANTIYLKDTCGIPFRWINIDIWADAFFDTPTVEQFIPKIYATLDWKVTPFLTTVISTAWNNTNGKPDYSNLALAWTINEDFAFTTEYRSRGPRYWRKGDPTNFILDSFRSIKELEASPLSDRRNTFLTHFFYRIHPDLAIELQTRNGWNRRNQPSYFEYKIDVTAAVKCNWTVQAGYEHRTNEDRYRLSASLGRHLPTPCCW